MASAWGLAALGAGLGGAAGLFGPDYQKAASDYADTMSQISSSFDPYVSQGFAAKKGLGAMSASQMMHPASLENRLALSYHQSPYQQQMTRNLENEMNTNAAMTGMLGSTAQDTALQNQLAKQQDQWQQQYINRGMHQYDIARQNLNQLGMMMAKQGFSADQIEAELEAQAAMAQLQAAMAPSGVQSALTDAMGGALGFLAIDDLLG